MKVKWTEYVSGSFMENVWSWYPDANSNDFDKHYEGEIIGTNSSFWYGETLTVGCTDGKIRTVAIHKVKFIDYV